MHSYSTDFQSLTSPCWGSKLNNLQFGSRQSQGGVLFVCFGGDFQFSKNYVLRICFTGKFILKIRKKKVKYNFKTDELKKKSKHFKEAWYIINITISRKKKFRDDSCIHQKLD